jgi:hypothetical protein
VRNVWLLGKEDREEACKENRKEKVAHLASVL